jgi:hypothetical protein
MLIKDCGFGRVCIRSGCFKKILVCIFIRSLEFIALCIISMYYLLPTLIPLSGIGTTCFSACCDKDSVIIFMTGRLTDVKPP